ncbi:hypothetical protein MRX96_036431 [Rhipicephalus microplus]
MALRSQSFGSARLALLVPLRQWFGHSRENARGRANRRGAKSLGGTAVALNATLTNGSEPCGRPRGDDGLLPFSSCLLSSRAASSLFSQMNESRDASGQRRGKTERNTTHHEKLTNRVP